MQTMNLKNKIRKIFASNYFSFGFFEPTEGVSEISFIQNDRLCRDNCRKVANTPLISTISHLGKIC